MSATIIWFRHDLRLADNPALGEALARGGAVVPVFIWAPDEEGDWAPGEASRWWLHHSLRTLQSALKALGSRLILRCGDSRSTLEALCKETGADAVFWNRRYEPAIIERDREIKRSLRAKTVNARSFNAALLHEPWTIRNTSGKPFQVFTPFWKHCLGMDDPASPLPAPKTMPAPTRWPSTTPLNALGLEPALDWTEGLDAAWTPGADEAGRQLKRFLGEPFDGYTENRNRPDRHGTSRLSPYLHFGELSPRQVWHALKRSAAQRGLPEKRWRGSQFLAELGWREFSHHLLYHFPHTPTDPLRSEFKKFPWRNDRRPLKAWQQGKTGYPFVDAGMRELWKTGWMHNRVRMVVASFLVKDLLIPWQEGAAWFWDTLVDADLAQNTLGWQWTSGCGADAAPYFRVFNPNTQGEKFDPDGQYVRKWCPELANLPDRWLHRPHEAPPEVLQAGEVTLGTSYPEPIVPHGIAREVALEAYNRIKKR